MNAYRIKQWDEWYESGESRKIKRLTFYSKPNKLVGEGIGLTLAQEDNLELLGTWALLEAIASTSERLLRGWLVRNGTALTPERLHALLPTVPARAFERALQHFSQPSVDWLVLAEIPGTPPEKAPDGKTPGESPGGLPQEGRKEGSSGTGKVGNGKEGSTDLPPLSQLPTDQQVLEWCAAEAVPLDYARAKIELAAERKDFAKAGWQNGWRDKLKRFWKADRATWGSKSKKTAALSGRPEGWRAGDAEWWWTDSLENVRAALHGAVQAGQKNAARLREIIKQRETS